MPYKVHCHDATGTIVLVFFHAHGDYLASVLPQGAKRFVSGRVERYNNTLQMTHPDHILDEAGFARLKPVEPVYPMTAGLTPRPLLKALGNALARRPALLEWQDKAWLAKQRWAPFWQALQSVHAPEDASDLAANAPARSRLAFDELLASQLALELVRRHMKRAKGRAIAGDGALRRTVIGALAFSLTPSQTLAVEEIETDMARPARMLRLLQGDVGSGKTIVALLAMLNAVECGFQAALMAPTEILARQHFNTLGALCRAAGVVVVMLTGRTSAKTRAAALEDIASGKAQLIVGTHALFQSGVEFHDLAIAIIDEQHRFGVHQRLALQAKSRTAIELLVMTATPIPRTLTLTYYGDMDVSRLTDKPAGRKPVTTRVLPVGRLEDVFARLADAVASGARVYWVCPLVEESESVDLAAARERAATLEKRFPGRVALVHGRMTAKEKERAMAGFMAGDSDILVATTVIEVGVDVSDATVMVVEHAERFGLAQLHQLRGRVGRGSAGSSCLLLYRGPLGETAAARLRIMRETQDGFRIAEEDLRLRGAGQVLGTRQSGMPGFRIAELACHGDLLAAARDDAKRILASDPDLVTRRGAALRQLLYLFEQDQAVRLLSAG